MKFDLARFRPSFIKDAPELDTNRKCLKCPTKLPPWLKFYCSGFCMDQAKMAGEYGKEV